jgi:hypothetical protein
MRIDYFSIMRKWHVGLYRYGLRLTYDLAIPEPGAAMRKIYADIDSLKKQIGPFSFDVTHDEISPDNNHYLDLFDRYKAQVLRPPSPKPPLIRNDNPVAGTGWHLVKLEFEVPSDYQISKVDLFADIQQPGTSSVPAIIVVEGMIPFFRRDRDRSNGIVSEDLPNFRKGETGPQTVFFNLVDVQGAFVQLTVSIEPTDDSKQRWKSDVWNILYNAAQTQYYAKQQDIQAQIAALEEKISNVDTLTLRREENEEIMKGVLRWLLGPNFHFMPDDVLAQFFIQSPIFNPNGNIDLIHGTVLDAARGDGLNVTAVGWYPMFMYQEMVKFINEAIEWENVLYFLYSYFWDVPPSWDFIRQLRHPDSTRQAFLRAGSARVVLTVRKGWETAWVSFVEAGGFGKLLPPNHPYMSIATEIQNYDETNYPGIPPANPGGGPLPDAGESVATQSSDSHAASASHVTITVASSVGFLAGYTAIIDDYASGIQEIQTIVAVPDATHITVKGLKNAHDGSTTPFAIRQGGEKGQLIAEWFEYTPTSGTDIAVTSKLATIE